MSQFTPKMKANAVPCLLSSLVWIDQYNQCNGMKSFMEFLLMFTMYIFSSYHSWIWLYFQEYVRTENWRKGVDDEWIQQMTEDLIKEKLLPKYALHPTLLEKRPEFVTCNNSVIVTGKTARHVSLLVKTHDGEYKAMRVNMLSYSPLNHAFYFSSAGSFSGRVGRITRKVHFAMFWY